MTLELDVKPDREQLLAFRKSSAVKQKKPDVFYRWHQVPPEQYKTTYGTLPRLDKVAPLETVFANGPASHSTPLVSRRSIEVLPGVYSFDSRVLNFQRELSKELNAAFKVDLDEDKLFTRTGVHTNFDRLRCPAGYFQTPMSYTAVDNALYREELGLTPGYSARQKAIARELWDLAARYIVVAPVNVPKLSTGGMRRFTSDPQWKLAYAEWLYDLPNFDNFERMLNAVAASDAETLANEFEAVYATYIQKRGQVDDPDKVRRVFDLEYALSGGRKGEPFPTDKKVVIDGVSYPDFSAIRARVVHAGPWVINCFLQVLSTTTMKSLFERFPATFHVNTADEIKQTVDGKYVFCSDVTEYDRSMSRDAIELPHEVMRKYWDERIVAASWRLFTSPYYAKPLDLDGRRGRWVMNPLDWREEVFAGNRSGHAWTSLVAKLNKVAETLFIIDMIYPVLGRVKEVLEGSYPMGVVNNGDDEIVWARTETDLARFRALREDLKNGHYVVKGEVGQAYSGQLLVKPTKAPVYFPSPRLQTPFEKMWVPERSIGGWHRPNWPIGIMTRIDSLMATDLGREAWSIHMSTYRRRLEADFGNLVDMLLQATAAMELNMEALSENDRLVLDNPDKIHHQIDPSEVSPDVLEKITSKIPVEVVEKFVKRYFKGSYS